MTTTDTYRYTGLTAEQLRRQLLLERFGPADAELIAEGQRPTAPGLSWRDDPHAPKPTSPPQVRVRPPAPPGRYLPEHDATRAWLRRHHAEWEPTLHVFDLGSVAHVVVRRSPNGSATTRCGKHGATFTASSEFPLCRRCVLTDPVSR